MKIAVSGTHCVGKTTLVGDLHRALSGYTAVDEPYVLLEGEGHPFAAVPELQDFEAQLEHSLRLLRESDADTIFDRCPADLLAYMLAHPDSQHADLDAWLPAVQEAMTSLNLVVHVPIEAPDRIAFSDPDDDGLRERMDEELRRILIDDWYGLGAEVLEVAGDENRRLQSVLDHLAGKEG